MQARVTAGQFHKEQLDAAIGIYGAAVTERYRDQPGFKGALLLVDRESGAGMSIALWETPDDVIANTWGGAYLDVLGEFAPYFATRPSFQVFEVGAQITLPAR